MAHLVTHIWRLRLNKDFFLNTFVSGVKGEQEVKCCRVSMADIKYINNIRSRRCPVKLITHYHHYFVGAITAEIPALSQSITDTFCNGTFLCLDCQKSQPKSSWLTCIKMHGQSSYNYWAKIPRALIHTVITQLKWCFLDLVIFCDKAYNSINPVLTLCFNFLWG